MNYKYKIILSVDTFKILKIYLFDNFLKLEANVIKTFKRN